MYVILYPSIYLSIYLSIYIVDVAVIDEAQMVRDQERGGAWTRAILGIIITVLYH